MILFCHATVPDENWKPKKNQYVGVCDGKINYVGELYRSGYEHEIDCDGFVLIPAFYNVHAHSAMTLLRGIGEDVPLDTWLHEKIFPFEATLTDDDIYWGTTLAVAEMLRYGTASCSDMYFRGCTMAKAYCDTGFRANVSVSVTCFDERGFSELPQYEEYQELCALYQNHPLIKPELALHAEYTTTPRVVREGAFYASEHGLGVQVHLSETYAEHAACISRHGKTPAQYFASCGLFANRTTAAHCVWTDSADRACLQKHGVTMASCPQSNLKLASGIPDYPSALRAGVRVALGTDGAASNNRLDLLKEARLMALLSKGKQQDASACTTAQALDAATRAGASAQGRHAGFIAEGWDADLALFPLTDVNMVPVRDAMTDLLYASDGLAALTMVNGKILYENGVYNTLDIDKARAEVQARAER